MMRSFNDILDEAGKLTASRMVVPDPRSDRVLSAIHEAKQAGFVVPILVGDEQSINKKLSSLNTQKEGYRIINEPDPSRRLTRSIELIRQKEADFLFQGDTETKDFLQAVTNDTSGIAKAPSLSYVSLFELPSQNRLILLTDTYIQEFPNLQQKMTILNNAISLANRLGIETPKVAVLSLVELVNPNFISTMDAAVLSKMSERKQFKAIVDGPLDIDCASSLERATRKGLKSPVSGEVDIYLFHDIESGYSVTELTVFLGKAQAAGALMGSDSPIILNISFETVHSLLVDIALARLRKR
jgi:phosphate butyryltransferase